MLNSELVRNLVYLGEYYIKVLKYFLLFRGIFVYL